MTRRLFMALLPQAVIHPPSSLDRKIDDVYAAENKFADAFNTWMPKMDKMMRNGILDLRVLKEGDKLEDLWKTFRTRVRELSK